MRVTQFLHILTSIWYHDFLICISLMTNDTNMCLFTIYISSSLEVSLFGRDFFIFSFVCCLGGRRGYPSQEGRCLRVGEGCLRPTRTKHLPGLLGHLCWDLFCWCGPPRCSDAQSCPTLATPWTIVYQAPLSMGFSRHEYGSGLAFPPPRESSRPRHQTCITCISCIGRWILYHYTTWETHLHRYLSVFLWKGGESQAVQGKGALSLTKHWMGYSPSIPLLVMLSFPGVVRRTFIWSGEGKAYLGCLQLLSCVHVWVLSRVWLIVIPWTVAWQAPLSMGFSRQEDCSGCHFLLQGIFLIQGSNPGLLHCRQILYYLSHLGSSHC